MTTKHPAKTATQVRAEMLEAGVSLAQWARTHRFSPQLVSKVLCGRSKALRGQSHRAAVLLGLKPGRVDRTAADLVATSVKRGGK